MGDAAAFTLYAADNGCVIDKTLTVNGVTLPMVKSLLTWCLNFFFLSAPLFQSIVKLKLIS